MDACDFGGAIDRTTKIHARILWGISFSVRVRAGLVVVRWMTTRGWLFFVLRLGNTGDDAGGEGLIPFIHEFR